MKKFANIFITTNYLSQRRLLPHPRPEAGYTNWGWQFNIILLFLFWFPFVVVCISFSFSGLFWAHAILHYIVQDPSSTFFKMFVCDVVSCWMFFFCFHFVFVFSSFSFVPFLAQVVLHYIVQDPSSHFSTFLFLISSCFDWFSFHTSSFFSNLLT